jgi:3-deoxy-manno-octulosonate cytidylyltransferase (CMP-KDO synthetase)
MKTIIIIPARYKSTRFPGKPLTPILGKPMILWVAELCAKALPIEFIYIATDDVQIKKVVEEAGYNVVMTSEKALTGTDRIADAANQLDADIYINVQGDEPLLNPKDILSIIDAKKKHPNEIINGCCKISDDEDPESLNIPKVVFNENNQMVYMSRQLIPGTKSKDLKSPTYYKQVCIYAFSNKELADYADFGRKSNLEHYEDIEILRFLDIGSIIRIVETKNASLAVDVPEDVIRVEEEILRKEKYQDNF